MSYGFETFSLLIKVSQYVLQIYYIMFAKLYYLYYSSDRGANIFLEGFMRSAGHMLGTKDQ